MSFDFLDDTVNDSDECIAQENIVHTNIKLSAATFDCIYKKLHHTIESIPAKIDDIEITISKTFKDDIIIDFNIMIPNDKINLTFHGI